MNESLSLWLCPFPTEADAALHRMGNVQFILDKPGELFLRALRLMAAGGHNEPTPGTELTAYCTRTKRCIEAAASLRSQDIGSDDVIAFALSPIEQQEFMLVMMQQTYHLPKRVEDIPEDISKIRYQKSGSFKGKSLKTTTLSATPMPSLLLRTVLESLRVLAELKRQCRTEMP